MFLSYLLTDTIVVNPNEFEGEKILVLQRKIEQKFLFKVLENEGLVVEIIHFSIIECVIVKGSGVYQFKLEIKLMLFKAVKDEILIGEIIDCDPSYLRVSLDFIDVTIPAENLNQPSFYDRVENTWVWNYENHKLFYDLGEKIRFKVVHMNISNKESIQLCINIGETINLIKDQGTKDDLIKQEELLIIGKTNQDGLGLLAWWSNNN